MHTITIQHKRGREKKSNETQKSKTLYTCQHPQSTNRGLCRLALLQNIYPSALLSIGIHAILSKARSARYDENNIESIPISSRPQPPRGTHFFITHLRVLHRAAYEGSLPLSCQRSLCSPGAVRQVHCQNYPVILLKEFLRPCLLS